MTLRRGFTVEPGQKVLITEDVFTTGGSAQEVVDTQAFIFYLDGFLVLPQEFPVCTWGSQQNALSF